MSLRIAPCGWVPDAPCASGPCCPDVTANPDVEALAKKLAAAILWRLTGMRYGCCEITVRPCKPETCDPLTLSDVIFWDQRVPNRLGAAGNLGVLSYFPTLIDGQIYNISCGCPSGCCKCKGSCEVRLPGPVCSITSVEKAGVIVDPANYTLYGNRLVFVTDPANPTVDACPSCQNYDRPLGQPDTWSVTYSVGVPVPDELNFAAGLYACELAKAMLGEKCALPERVSGVVRPGVSISFDDPLEYLDRGLTGLVVVDRIIKAINPYQLSTNSSVWYAGMPKTRREN